MSRRVHPTCKEPKAACCHICQKAGESSQVVMSHNFRDPKGRVVCPNFLTKLNDNKCDLCDKNGHFSDKCPEPIARQLAIKQEIYPRLVKKAVIKVKVRANQWDLLGLDSSDEDETFAKVAPNVTVRRKIKASERNWADDSDDEEEDCGKTAPWAKK